MVNHMDDTNVLQTTLKERNHNKRVQMYDSIHITYQRLSCTLLDSIMTKNEAWWELSRDLQLHIIILKKKKNAIKWKLAEKCPTAPDTVLPAARVEEGGEGPGILVSGHLCFFYSFFWSFTSAWMEPLDGCGHSRWQWPKSLYFNPGAPKLRRGASKMVTKCGFLSRVQGLRRRGRNKVWA